MEILKRILGFLGAIVIIALIIYLANLTTSEKAVKEEAELKELEEETTELKPPLKELFPEEVEKPEEADLNQIVENELNKLSKGKIIFNTPEEMEVDVTESVIVQIVKKFTKDLEKEIKGSGVSQVEDIKVGTFMKARLSGENFKIKELSHASQVIPEDGFAQWEWRVTPLKRGMQSLLLTVTVRIKILGNGEETLDYPVFEREIYVRVNRFHMFIKFVKNNWQWIIAVIVMPIVGWIVKKKWFSKKD